MPHWLHISLDTIPSFCVHSTGMLATSTSSEPHLYHYPLSTSYWQPPCDYTMATGVTTTSAIAAISQDTTQTVFIGQGLPPVPKKLASKIESGEFVDMLELLPDRLGCSRIITPEDKSGRTKSKK